MISSNNIIGQNNDQCPNDQINIVGSTFSLATNNVCGLNEPTKQNAILNLIEYKNYDIFGLSKTKLTSLASLHLYKHRDDFKSWWNCYDNAPPLLASV